MNRPRPLPETWSTDCEQCCGTVAPCCPACHAQASHATPFLLMVWRASTVTNSMFLTFTDQLERAASIAYTERAMVVPLPVMLDYRDADVRPMSAAEIPTWEDRRPDPLNVAGRVVRPAQDDDTEVRPPLPRRETAPMARPEGLYGAQGGRPVRQDPPRALRPVQGAQGVQWPADGRHHHR